ncbi:MAG: M48 family metalloprotease [Candidatus Nanohalobium sp.]
MFNRQLARSQAKDDTARGHAIQVLNNIAQERDFEFDKDSLTAVDQTLLGRLAGVRHDFEIEVRSGHFLVEERISVSVVWHLLWIIPLVFFSSYTIFSFELTLVSLLGSLLSLIMILVWMASSVIQSFLSLGRKEFRDLEEYSTVYIFTPVISTVFLIACFMSDSFGYEYVNGLLFSALLVTEAVDLILVGCDGFCPAVRFEYSLLQNSPSTALLLAATMSGLMTGVLAFGPDLFIAFGPDITSHLHNPIGLYLVGVLSQRIAIIGISGLILWILVKYIRLAGLDDYHSFIEEYRTASRKTQILAIGLFPFVFYTLMFAAVRVFQRYIVPNVVRDPLLVVGILASLLPVLYFPAGILYQTVDHFSSMYRLFDDSEPVPGVCSSQAEVRSWKMEGDSSYQAASISTGLKNYILITEDMLDDFDKPMVQAVIVHEEAHIRNGEALLSFYIPVFSLLTLTGRNLFYSLIDYQGREFEADREAAQTVGGQPLIDVLNNLQDEQSSEEVAATGLSPFDGGFEDETGVRQYLDIFFGNYAIRESHPETEERISQIEEYM